MIKKIVISRFNNVAAVLLNNKIQEVIVINNTYQVNDIYIGIVQRIFPSINAAFIRLNNTKKSGFIHLNDIKPLQKKYNTNRITEILSVNQLIVVQIIKEPTKNKGPRLTTNINLTGRYVVLMPFCNTVCVSHKVYDENERTYLQSLAVLIKPPAMGILVRSAAQGIREKLIIEDLTQLKKQWNFVEKLATFTNLPTLIHKEEDLIQKVIRDYYERSVNKIIIDSKSGLRQIKHHLDRWECVAPITKVKLQLHSKPECILKEFNIKQTIIRALQPKVRLTLGGHIIIENNEAFTVIDVNSGSFNKSDNCKETILRTNLYAAIEIAYQLKVRNINGIIIIDFIDMQSQKDQLQLLEHFSNLLNIDNAKPRIVQLSELGLIELTRRRRGQSLKELFYSKTHTYINANQTSDLEYSIQKKTFTFHKNIQSLFFNKKFYKNTVLKIKKLTCSTISRSNLYLSLDKTHTINLLNPYHNYMIPLILYRKTVKSIVK